MACRYRWAGPAFPVAGTHLEQGLGTPAGLIEAQRQSRVPRGKGSFGERKTPTYL